MIRVHKDTIWIILLFQNIHNYICTQGHFMGWKLWKACKIPKVNLTRRYYTSGHTNIRNNNATCNSNNKNYWKYNNNNNNNNNNIIIIITNNINNAKKN